MRKKHRDLFFWFQNRLNPIFNELQRVSQCVSDLRSQTLFENLGDHLDLLSLCVMCHSSFVLQSPFLLKNHSWSWYVLTIAGSWIIFDSLPLSLKGHIVCFLFDIPLTGLGRLGCLTGPRPLSSIFFLLPWPLELFPNAPAPSRGLHLFEWADAKEPREKPPSCDAIGNKRSFIIYHYTSEQ